MNQYARIEIYPIEVTPHGDARLLQTATELGLHDVTAIHPARLFFLSHPELTAEQVERLCQTVLVDPVVERYQWQWGQNDNDDKLAHVPPPAAAIVEVEFLPGVTDRVAYEVQQAALRLGLPALKVTTGWRYQVKGGPVDDETTLRWLARQVLCNEVVQHYRLGQIKPAFVEEVAGDNLVEQLDLRELDDEALLNLSQARRLALNLAEMTVLRTFSQQQNRPLTDAELEMVAQTWSEHCFHKTFKAQIYYKEIDHESQPVKEEQIDGLLNATIRAATEACSKKWLVSTFVDNAGIIEFDDEYVLSFKVETHNHPSALEPFGGANTGVGGVIRDIVGVSAKPIAVTDVLCFGPQDLPPADLPEGSLHPRRVQAGVVAGVGDYGNKMGIPNVNGAVIYHPGYIANPLVYCGCVGLAPKDSHVTNPQVGDHVIVLGGRTGRDGLRGATFSSLDLDSETSEASFASTAVQIGDPIVEKDVTEVIMLARDQRLYNAITDCGAGGLSSAVGEMGQELGATVELTKVGLKYPGLRPWEIWLSEAQERMVLAVPEENLPALAALCDRYAVDWDDIGQISGDQQMIVRHEGRDVVNLPMRLLHDQHPRLKLTAQWQHPATPPPPTRTDRTRLNAINCKEVLFTLLSDPNVASKEAIIRTYDHEVQGGTVIKPLTGVENHGPSDAAVIKPLGTKGPQGVAVSNGINPLYGLVDPYKMALSAVDEAIRNAVAVGADPDKLALLDNFCWGNPNLPDRLGGLVRAAQGCHDAARHFDLPFISGKDSLNNEYVDAQGERTPIPGTLLISAIGIVPDIERVVTMDLKQPGNFIYIVGETRDELAGSLFAHYYDAVIGHTAPDLPEQALRNARCLHQAIQKGLVRACHDLSEGGLAVAAAEMALAGGLGIKLNLRRVPSVTNHALLTLFSESNGRWLVEVPPEHAMPFEDVMRGCLIGYCGKVLAEPRIKIGTIDVSVAEINRAWRGETQ